ncbi:MAG: hypothetical protein M1833_001322 [Piccolia ochrophora]|nr:MAG: hypothetical protein M1833_001322 [Piccolia ochrophora]
MKSLAAWAALALMSTEGLYSFAQETETSGEDDTTTTTQRTTQYEVDADTYVRRAFHSSVIVGDWLYIDGGDIVTRNADGEAQQTSRQYMSRFFVSPADQLLENTTLAVDLTQSWNDTFAPLNILETTKPEGCPSLNRGSLWSDPTDGTLVMGFSGETSAGENSEPYPLSVWRFTPNGRGGGSWNESTDAIDPAFGTITRPSSGLTAFSNESAYYLGGYSNYLTSEDTKDLRPDDTIPLPGMIEYNFQTGAWHNNSAAKYSPKGIGAFGRMEYVPNFGEKGLFVMIGGAIDGLKSYYADNTPQKFDNITVFDPATQEWYSQATTGDVPDPRYSFCSAGVKPIDANTFEIFVFGGFGGVNGQEATKFDETFVLTIPGFNWFRAPYPPTAPRYGHTCHSLGNRQVMTIGGVAAHVDPRKKWVEPDNVKQGFGIFDMSAMLWNTGYDPQAADYFQSPPVKSFYTSKGRFPTWTQKELGVLMGDTSISTAAPVNTAARAGTIAGALIGGLILISLLLGGLLVFLRRRRRNADIKNQISGPVMLDSKTAVTEAYTNFSKPAMVLGMNGRPQRIVELAHPQVAAYELDAGQYKLKEDDMLSSVGSRSSKGSGGRSSRGDRTRSSKEPKL